jgi:NTP pyrophosphatase (non-canonical NTP hydrolase)
MNVREYKEKRQLLEEYHESVLALSRVQMSKLAENIHKGKWEDVEPMYAFKRLMQEAIELFEEIQREGVPEDVWKEAADVANFAMILAQTYEQQHKQTHE